MQNSYKRIDAHLSTLGYCTRSEAKKFMKIYELYVKEDRVFDPSIKAYYRDWETDRKSTRLNSSHSGESRMPSSA